MGLKNMSSPIERDVTFTCHVRNIGHYRVSGRGREGLGVTRNYHHSFDQVGWVKADTKAIQAIGDQIITHNQRVSVSGDFVSTFNLHIK